MYKTILVHADLSPEAEARYILAAHLANTMGACLIGSAPTGVSRFAMRQSIEQGGPAITAQYARMQGQARAALERFEAVARAQGVASIEARVVDDDLDGGMALQARYSDLVIVGQTDYDRPMPDGRHDLPEYLMMTSGRPILVTPRAGCPSTLGGHAVRLPVVFAH
jgi:nucleotide-binding universal stress UspA family protein